jgi:hypothetical protein
MTGIGTSTAMIGVGGAPITGAPGAGAVVRRDGELTGTTGRGSGGSTGSATIRSFSDMRAVNGVRVAMTASAMNAP